MTIAQIFDLLLGGLILGGLYALIAVGLGLQYGVARVLNVSHGEFIMLGAFATYSLHTLAGLNPILSLAISGPIIFLIAFGLHLTLFRYLRKKSPTQTAFEGNSLLASFGLLFVIQSLVLFQPSEELARATRIKADGHLRVERVVDQPLELPVLSRNHIRPSALRLQPQEDDCVYGIPQPVVRLDLVQDPHAEPDVLLVVQQVDVHLLGSDHP